MGKPKRAGGARKKTQKDTKTPKFRNFTEEDIDDEIDAFHKQRDIVSLDVDEDTDSSDEYDELPIMDSEGSDDYDEDEYEDEEDEEDEDDKFTAKIAKQQQIMRRKTGGVEDDMHDANVAEKQPKHQWEGRNPYGGDNADFEIQSSDDEDALAEEEAEVLRIQGDQTKKFSNEDFGLKDSDEEESSSDEEKTLEDVLPKARVRSKRQEDKEDEVDASTAYEIKKDLDALSREEQMDVVYSSAPELVGLLSELRDAVDQLENKVNPLISKVKERKDCSKEGIRYLETKQLLLLAYSQAISFYLLLKSEGQPVRDHPVIARLVEIKTLLDKMKELDYKLPSELEEILNQDTGTEAQAKLIESPVTLTSKHVSRDNGHLSVSVKSTKEAQAHETTDSMNGELLANGNKKENRKQQTRETTELTKDSFSEKTGNKQENQKQQVGLQSLEMLKVRASLDEKLKKKGVFTTVANKSNRSQKFPSQRMNSQLETLDDFGDEVIDKEMVNSSKLSKLVATKLVNKSKVVSGDDDLPKRDDIGERRRKHEMRVLSNAGVESDDEIRDKRKSLKRGKNVKSVGSDIQEDDKTEDSDNPLYEQVKRQRLTKLSAKAELYSRTPVLPLAEPESVDGKRQINRQMEKNRGLTRARNKKLKNPRKKYREKHANKEMRRKGQVRDIKKPSGPYGGETSGINAGISRSRRL